MNERVGFEGVAVMDEGGGAAGVRYIAAVKVEPKTGKKNKFREA